MIAALFFPFVLASSALGGGDHSGSEWGVPVAPGGRSGCCSGLGVDAEGNAYFAGTFDGAIEIQEHALEAAGLHDTFLAKFDPTGHCLWARAGGSPNEDHAVEAAVAPDGFSYLVGRVDGSSRFGEKLLLYFMETKSFLARYAPDGECLWVVTARGKLEESVRAVAVAPGGDALIVGTHVAKQSAEDVPTAYLARYAAADGEKLWVRDIEGTGRSLAVSVDSSGGIYVADAVPEGPFARGGGPRHPLPKAPLLACFDADGEPLWTWSPGIGGPDRRSGRLVAVDAEPGGGCFVAGEILGEASFGEQSPEARGELDGFVAFVDREGQCRWVARFGGAADDHVFDVARDGAGGCVVSASAGPGPATFGEHRVEGDAQTLVVAGIDSRGRIRWIESGTGPGADEQEAIGDEIATDLDGAIFVGGWFRERLELGGVELAGGRDEQFLIRLTR